jgi:hypothetical protein
VAACAASAMLAGLAEAATGGGTCGTLQKLSIAVGLALLLALLTLKPNALPLQHSIALSNAAVTAISSILGELDFDTSYLTAVQAVLNVAGMLIIFWALISEGCLSKCARRLMYVLQCVWKGIALRRRQHARPRPSTPESQLEHEVCAAIAWHSPPYPPPTAAEISRILETLLRLSACAAENARLRRMEQMEQRE